MSLFGSFPDRNSASFPTFHFSGFNSRCAATVLLNEDQQAIQQTALSFAEKTMLPQAAYFDEKEIFPVEIMRQAAELGFGGVTVSEEYGGTALSRLDSSVIFEALSAADPSTSAFISIHK